jgi:hypothetical protein
VGENPHERSRVFHDLGGPSKGPGQMFLTPGPLSVGSDSTTGVPSDIWRTTARVVAHSHPFTGRHLHNERIRSQTPSFH